MKKVILLIALLALTACSSNSINLNTEPEKTVSELGNKFTYVTGKILKDNVLVKYTTLDRGEEYTFVSADDELVYIEKDNLVLGVKTGLIRSNNEPKFEEYDGFAKSGIGFYKDYGLSEKIRNLSLNDKVTVIDSFDGVLYVSVNGELGSIAGGNVSETKIPTYVPPKKEEQKPESSYTPSQDNRDGQDIPTPSNPPSSSDDGRDGQDISLSFSYQEGEAQWLEGSKLYTVLADNTPAYITRLNRGDVVDIVEIGEKETTVLIAGRLGTIPSIFVRDDSEMYLEWTGYATSNAPVYKEYELENRVETYKLNSKVKIIDEVGNRFVVELKDGEIGYMLKKNVSDSEIYVAPKPQETTPTPVTPSQNPTPAPTPAPAPGGEWTPPML